MLIIYFVFTNRNVNNWKYKETSLKDDVKHERQDNHYNTGGSHIVYI